MEERDGASIRRLRGRGRGAGWCLLARLLDLGLALLDGWKLLDAFVLDMIAG